MGQSLTIAKEATGVPREMRRHGIALARLTLKPVARKLLRDCADDDTLARFAQIRELLNHLEDAIRALSEVRRIVSAQPVFLAYPYEIIARHPVHVPSDFKKCQTAQSPRALEFGVSSSALTAAGHVTGSAVG